MSTNPQESTVARVLIVSGNSDIRQNLTAKLKHSRWWSDSVGSGAEAFDQLFQQKYDVLLLDPMLPDLEVNEFKSLLSSEFPALQLVTVNPHTGIPYDINALPAVAKIIQDLEHQPGGAPVYSGQNLPTSDAPTGLPGLVGQSEPMKKVYGLARLVASRDTTVLIVGQSGTGKDLFARAIHDLSPRRGNTFAVINCAAIPEPLLEAELFGYVKGAFTGAVQSRIGRIQAAHGGTLFLDEIGEMPLALQSKLLRFLEQGELQRLGSSDNFRVDVRVIAATNATLQHLVRDKLFREDLYYRLAVFPIQLPPLKERASDIPVLCEFFLVRYCGRRVWIHPEAMELLVKHSWPGNVRELRNVMERASILLGSDREVQTRHISL